jgi:HlyD family secretion protein
MQNTATDKRRRRTRRIVIGAVVLLIVAGGLVLPRMFGRMRSRRAAAQAAPGDVVTVFRGDLSAAVTASGRVESNQATRLSVNNAGIVKRVYVEIGDAVEAGDVLVQLETDDLALKVKRAAQALALSKANLEALLTPSRDEDIASAEAAVLSAQTHLDNLKAGASAQDIAESEANLRAQEASLASALASYQGTLDTVKDSAIAAAQIDVINAQIAYDNAQEINEDHPNGDTHEALEDAARDLEIAQTALDDLSAGPYQGTVDSSAAQVTAARANVDEARANHTKLLQGATDSQIAAAQASLAQAKANLASLLEGASAEAIAVAEAEVEQARLALADAQDALEQATITAPLDGIVTDVYVAVGEYASGDVVELVATALYVVLNVDEVDIGTLDVGQPASITLETWPDTPIAGHIAAIAPQADVSSDGIVSFEVHVDMGETNLPVLVGMTANARLITARREDVLLVPNAALTADRKAGTYTVNLVHTDSSEADGSPRVEPVQVNIGFRDDTFTEITGGLTEGDTVLIGELKAPSQQRRGPFSRP